MNKKISAYFVVSILSILLQTDVHAGKRNSVIATINVGVTQMLLQLHPIIITPMSQTTITTPSLTKIP